MVRILLKKIRLKRLSILLILCLAFSNLICQKKIVLVVNYEPAFIVASNSINRSYLVSLRTELGIGVSINQNFIFGAQFESTKVWTNIDPFPMPEGRLGVGGFVRIYFPWSVKDKRVRFYSEITIHFRNYNTIPPFIKTVNYQYGQLRGTFGFEVKLWKYFYMNIGIRPVFFFDEPPELTMKPQLEFQIPLNYKS